MLRLSALDASSENSFKSNYNSDLTTQISKSARGITEGNNDLTLELSRMNFHSKMTKATHAI